MSEKLIYKPEAQNEYEKLGEHDAGNRPEVDHQNLEKEQTKQLEASRVTAEQHAVPARLLASEKDESAPDFQLGTHQALKKDSYANLLNQTRQHLPTAAKQFSKIVHQKNIEAISNVGAQTVARPSGLLGGGIGALMGSLTLLYYAKHYGFSYNYTFVFITFLFGFVVGLGVEILMR